MKIDARVSRLEAMIPAVVGTAHRIIQHLGMSRDDALLAYGPDRIGLSDTIIIRRVVAAPEN